ncbi:hypothetical protein, partial [Pseudomonas aeruginosa]
KKKKSASRRQAPGSAGDTAERRAAKA